MSLYAIGDLHLHYQSVLKAPGQLHGRVWKNHEEKFRKNCAKTVTPEQNSDPRGHFGPCWRPQLGQKSAGV